MKGKSKREAAGGGGLGHEWPRLSYVILYLSLSFSRSFI